MQFHFGLGKFFTTFDKTHRSVMRKVIEADFGIHYNLDYSGSGQFFNKMTSSSEKQKTKIIAGIPCYNMDILNSEIYKTMKILGVDKIDTIQIQGEQNVFDCYDKNSLLYETCQLLKEKNIINNFLPQLYYDQTKQLANYKNIHTPFTFYGSPLGIHIDEDVINNNSFHDSIAMTIFGGVDKNNLPVFNNKMEQNYYDYLMNKYTWADICLMNLENFTWINKVVGTTGSIKHIDEIINYFNTNTIKEEKELEILNKISIQSCSKEHLVGTNNFEKWLIKHKHLRSTKVYIKSLTYHYIKKNKYIHSFVDKATGRS
jgi:hypothetical protein